MHRETSALRFALADAGRRDQRGAAADHRRRRRRGVHVVPLRGRGLHALPPVRLEPVPERHRRGGRAARPDARHPRDDRREDGREGARGTRSRTRVQIAWVEDYSVLAVAAVDDDTAQASTTARCTTIAADELAERARRGSASSATGCSRSSPASRTSTAPCARASMACANGARQAAEPGHVARRHRPLGRRRSTRAWAEVPARQAPRRRAARHGRSDPRADGLLRRLQAQRPARGGGLLDEPH